MFLLATFVAIWSTLVVERTERPMRPANFPARKDERRQKALTRLLNHGTQGKLTQVEVDLMSDKLTGLLNPNARNQRSKNLHLAQRQADAA